MIIGIGHDLTDVGRVTKIVSGKTGKRFLERILSIEEFEIAAAYEGERLHQFTAGRFAVKEAVVKAFGCGIGSIVAFTDIDIARGSNGKPECSLSEAAWIRLGLSPNNIRIHVTITHEKTLASAFAVIERIIE